MQSEILRMDGTAGKDAAASIAQLLKSVNGVSEVTVSVERNEVIVQFDEKIASKKSLQATLATAGFGAATEKPVHGENGSCCGGCGG